VAQPESITVTEGTKVGFLVEAEGVGLGYQWYHNGEIVRPRGATDAGQNESATAALRLAPVTLSDAGEYHAVVSNTVGEVTSSIVELTVLPSG
jgi:hypothetical protein